jgi:hypothetical protein
MPKRNAFLQQLERRRQTHLVNAKSHVDKPSELSLEELEAEKKRLEVERTRQEVHFWEEKRQANIGGDGLEFGLATNRKRFSLPKKKRPRWK